MALYPRMVEVSLAGAGEAINFGGLMVGWKVQRTTDSRQPSGTISLFNLAEQTERRIKNRYTEIRLSAGYPDRFGILVDATIKDVVRDQQGLDRVAHVEIGGRSSGVRGQPASRRVTVDLSYEGPVALEVIAAAVAAKMGLTVETASHVAAAGVVLDDYASGRAPAHQVLDDLLTPYGLGWYEDTGGVLRFRKTGVVGVGKGGVLIVSEATGMIGKPGITEDGLRVQTLIDHRAELDGRVFVSSAFYGPEVGGAWKIVAVRHWGDSRDGEAVTEMDLRPV